MSTALAMAAVTVVLKSRLENRLAAADVQSSIGPVLVTAVPPDQVQAGAAEPSQLNLYLHHVTTNPAWRNEGHPLRDGQGRRVSLAPLALDLQYLVTAFGVETYAAEILLGLAITEFHEHPLLDPASVGQVLHRTPPDPTVPTAVVASRLEQQGEALRICPVVVATEEMSRLWTALGAQYRATAAYLVGPLLITPEDDAASALPVRSPSSDPSMMTVLTVRDVVRAPTGLERPDPGAPVEATDHVLVRGEGLTDGDVTVMIGCDALTATARRPGGLVVDLGTASGLRPGPVTAQVIAGPVSRSNVVLFDVRPAIAPALAGTTLTCTVHPPVGRTQRAVLLLNEYGATPGAVPRAYTFAASEGNGAAGTAQTSVSVPFDVSAAAPGTYVVRLDVDGVSTVPGTDAQGRFATPVVTVG